ncbi:MAG: hypothetical protein CVV37_00830 [Nitrospira bacterium HGW-Nitrospira-1]|nr:MAG: hypothetical protein CVV37_00830 [Nitrospira bacterium HGW-Nitrospira-1]
MAYKLLLADDSITIQKVVELVLAEEDFQITSVSNGEDALNLLDSFMPDIVLADIEMPKVNGYNLCEKIKKNPLTSHVPVILLAGAFEPIDEELAGEVGADDFVIKPFESQELINKINAALAMVSAEASEVALSGDEEAVEEVVEEQGIEEAFEVMEEAPASALELKPEPVMEEETARPAVAGAMITEAEIPSKEEFLRSFEKVIDEKASSLLSELDIKEALLSSLMPSIKDTVEKVLWETAPELTEKVLKEILKSSALSLTTKVEKAIWETVSGLANKMISEKTENIKSDS